MSDEHKPHDAPAHDDHGHDAGHGHDDHAAAPAAATHDGAAHDDHAPETHAPEAHDAHAVIHDEHVEPVVAHGDGHEAGLAPQVHEDHAPVVHDEAAAVVTQDEALVHEEPAHAPHPTPVDAAAVTAAAAVAAAPDQKRPVWSDQGDAPFEDVDTTPVYARGKKGKKSSGGGSAANEGWEVIKTVFFALLIALVLRVLLFQPFTIPSASMEPNLYEGDYIVVSKWTYGYSKHSIPFSPPIFDGRVSLPFVSHAPTRGDIVVFKLPRDNKTDYIKRLIGLPGDRIQMVSNVLHINGQPVRDVVMSSTDVTNMYGMPIVQADETFPDGSKTFRIQDFGPGNDLDDTPVFEVPAGHYFMMGDNRDNSIDSRVDPSQNGVGLVPAENLIGKAEIILFSWNEGASLWNPVSWFSKVRLDRW
ncbi:MAG: signal peptidase I, partial [Brevundimonas sp.]